MSETPSAEPSPDIPGRLAAVYARYFRRHLIEELRKDARLLDHVTTEGRPYRDLVVDMLADMDREFPEPAGSPLAPYNLFERWSSHGRAEGDYREHSFKMHNQLFFARLLALRDQDGRSRRVLRDRVQRILSQGRFYNGGFSFSRFYRAENVMKECLRDIIDEHPELPLRECRRILMADSELLMDAAFRYFDRMLKNALGESERLLLNILPEAVSTELKEKGAVEPVLVPAATVLFTDFQGFTAIAERMAPRELIRELDNCFSYFDRVTERYHLEKIKTIGDAYMCVAGVPRSHPAHAARAVLAALEIQAFMRQMKRIKADLGEPYWELRLGLHTGPLVAGVIGEKKFSYDIWGDTVNTASRLESAGEPGRINVSAELKTAVDEFFVTAYRGRLAAKNKGEIEMFFVERIKPAFADDPDGRVPNAALRECIAG